MVFHDQDDYDDDINYGDDALDEEDDAEDTDSRSKLRSNIRPFGAGGGSGSGSGLPGTGSGRFESGIRPGGAQPTSRDDPNRRPGSGGAPHSSSSPSSSSGSGSGGRFGGPGDSGQRPSGGSGGSSFRPGSGSGGSSGSGGGSLLGSSGGQRPGGGSGGGSGSGSSGGSGGSSFRPSSGSGGSGGGSGFGSRPDDRGGSGGGSGFGSRPTSGSGGSGFGSRPDDRGGSGGRPDDRKPDMRPAKPSGDSEKKGGGLMGRFGLGGDKKPADKDPKREGNRPALGRPAPGDSSKAGAALGGITAGVTGAFSGLTSRFSRDKDGKGAKPGKPGDKPAKPAGDNKSGGFFSRNKTPEPTKGGTPASSASSGFGSRPGGGTGSGFGAAGTPGAARPGAPSPGGAKPAGKDAKGPRTGLGARLMAPFRSLGLGDDKKGRTSKTRTAAAKTPVVQNEGMSLDRKLDILGVALVFGAMMLFFSALSADQGAITGQINAFFGRMLGWGAIAVPVAMLAAGVWLIVRHFGDNPPVLDLQRVIGLILTYVGLLVLFHYIESLNPVYDGNIEFFRFYGHNSGRGGGVVGTEIYLTLVGLIGEVGGVFIVAGWFVICAMLVTRTSAAELSVIIISLYRSFRVAQKHRGQRRAAERLLREQEAAQLALSKPQTTAELPAGSQGALPAPNPANGPQQIPLPIEERPIPIRMGGQMIAADEMLPPPATVAPGRFQKAEAVQQRGDGRLNRIVNILPRRGGSTASAPDAPKKAEGRDAPRPSGGILTRFTRRSASDGAPGDNQPAADIPRPRTAEPGQSGVGPLTAAAVVTGAAVAGAIHAVTGRAADKPDKSADKTPPAEPLKPAASVTPFAAPTAQPVKPAPHVDHGETESHTDSDAQPASPAVTRPNLGTPASSILGRTPESPAHRTPLTPMPRPGSSHFADRPKPAEPPTAPAEPVKPAANLDADLDADLLKPAKPRGLFTGQKAAITPPVIPSAPEKPAEQPTPAAKEETEPAAAPSADRLSRLEQLRAGQTRPMPAAPSDSQPAARPVTPAASTPTPASPFSRPGTESEPVKPAPVTPAAANPAAASSPFGPKPVAPAANLPTTPPGVPPVVPSKPGVTAHSTRQKKQWTLADYKTLLASGSEQDFDRETLVKRARVIEETLQSFGAPGRVVEINTGPVITQFGVEPDYLMARGGKKSRVKVSAIAQLDKDLQLSLNAKSIRIEAPVPGKGFVGIEVPNDEAATVNLRDVMESREFKRIKSPLAIALGQSVDGAPVAADLAAMPHLLIAGTTGSGKSVCVNAVIISLILQNSPEVVKFIMVDPKRVELTGYNGIPHLVAPVVVELERVVGVLKWVTREMDERYKRFSNAGARNIVDYNNHLPEGSEQMPYIVVIIDELADLMMLAPDETERTITRIAALARATGIHLVIATQRPSVDVVTGLIKANFPARIAFAVASGIDSRVILDQPGAEKLLGRGDMLYMSGDSPAPLRLQGVYVSDAEINNVNRFWRAQQIDAPKTPVMSMAMDDSPVPMKPQAASSPSGRPNGKAQQAFWDDDEAEEDDGPATGQDDEMYEEAVELVRRLNKASVSLLQRRLRIGYTRAARLIDVMEERGIVGPPTEGSKPRMVLPVRPE